MNTDTPFDWGDHDVAEGGEHALRLGPLNLLFARRSGEVRIAFDYADAPAEEVEWSRWAPGGNWDGRIRLGPRHPDRLMVVKPENEFWLMREARARIYVRVPLHVHIEAVGSSARRLLRIPTEVLSDTWWGTPEEGELGYWLDTRARREMGSEDFEEHLCVCPLQLENASRDELHVDRIALRVAHLSIFRQGQRLWADETRIRYLGDDAGSRIEMTGKPPTEAPDAELLTPPDDPISRGFTGRTFARIRSSIGGWL